MTHSSSAVSIVMIEDLGIMGVLLSEGTYASLVLYYDDGFRYEEYMENDDFTVVDTIRFAGEDD